MASFFGAMSIAQLSLLIQSGEADPVAVTEGVFDGIDQYADKAVFTVLLRERAMRDAQASARRIRDGRSLGALDGIPLAWKDLVDLEGMATTAGSVVLADNAVAVRDAAVVASLKNAGMVAIGRTNMSELAFSGLGHNPIAFGCPVPGAAPLVFDIACSVAARGHILLAAREGKPIPAGWAVDEEGAPTTDAKRALKGALLPMGGHKGMGIAMMVECLAVAMAATAASLDPRRNTVPESGARMPG